MARTFIPGQREPDVVASSTLGYFFREALRRIWKAKRTSFVAISMIAISLLILGSFLLVAENLQRAVERWQGRSRVTVYFDASATEPQIAAVGAFLAGHADLAQRRFVTRQEALVRFRSYFTNVSEVVGQLDENPFPPSFECDVAPRAVQSAAFAGEIAALRGMGGVEQVEYDWDWIRQLKRLVSLINLAGLVAGGILAIAAAFTIANVIRLKMMLYREEVDIMRLVGATEGIIRGPFLVEGILEGTLGGILAVLLLLAAFFAGRHFLAPSASLLWGFLFAGFLPWQKIAALIAGGMLAGWFGSWLSVRERTDVEV
jgi:cell division transport system permease protein